MSGDGGSSLYQWHILKCAKGGGLGGLGTEKSLPSGFQGQSPRYGVWRTSPEVEDINECLDFDVLAEKISKIAKIIPSSTAEGGPCASPLNTPLASVMR